MSNPAPKEEHHEYVRGQSRAIERPRPVDEATEAGNRRGDRRGQFGSCRHGVGRAARQQFEGDWNTTFKSALNRLNEAFEVAGTDCINRSSDLQRVMGAR